MENGSGDRIRVGIYLEDYSFFLGSELYSKLHRAGLEVEVSQKKLEDNPDMKGVDIAVFHPPYDNKNGDWDKIKEFMDKNSSTLFYMLAINASERIEFFGNKKNLEYVEDGDFFRDCVKEITRGYERFKRE